jgi:hypothetical protein
MAEQSLEPVSLWFVLVIISALNFYGACRPSYADAIQEYTAKSVLALNLARFSDWPPEIFQDSGSSVNLCLLGDEIVQQAFNFFDKKQLGNKTLSVLNINETKQLDHCHLLYISAESRIPATLLEESYQSHILTIGESEDFLAHGGMVYLKIIDPKINLNVNLAAIQKAGVQLSSRVLKLATLFKQ